MNPLTHAFISWSLSTALVEGRKERAALTLAGILPDLDAFGYLPEVITRGAIPWFSLYHHVLAHNLLAAVFFSCAAVLVFRRNWRVPALVFCFFHLHLFCDIVGGKGPGGYEWPIPYLWPFLPSLEITWSGQWALNAWPNFLISGLCLLYIFVFAWRKGFSILELISLKADAVFVEAMRRRFGRPEKWTHAC
jgi:inner membrane protein